MTPLLSRRRFLTAAGAVVVAGPSLAACAPDREQIRRLSMLNWQDYVADGLLDGFTDATGIEVVYDTYESNDELLVRLEQAGRVRRGGRSGSTFDLIVPSDNLVTRLIDAGELTELDQDQLPSLANLDPALRSLPIDPDHGFTVPWATGTTGIGYDTTVFAEPPGWEVFLDGDHAGRLSLLDETRDAFAAALFSLDEDPNSTDPTVIDAGADRLAAMLEVAELDSATYLDRLAAGELVAAQGYSSDVLQARQVNPDIGFVLPDQGALRWVDLLAVPIGAARVTNAHRFVEHYLGPEVAAANSQAVLVDTGNEAARALLPDELLADPVVFPPEDLVDRLAFTEDLGNEVEARYAEAFDRLRG